VTLSVIDLDRWELMETVIDEYHHNPNETQIAKKLGLPRKEVLALLDDYRAVLSQDSAARDYARDHLHMMGKHYDVLIKKFYDLIDEIDTLGFNHQVAAQKNAALKAIAELEAKRLDSYQKAGLLESADLGDELAEREEREDRILGILEHDLCAQCLTNISPKLIALKGTVPVVEYVEGDVL